MRNIKLKECLAIVCLFLLLLTNAQDLEEYELVDYSLHSKTLNETRTGKFFKSELNKEALITFYVLDGEWNIDYVRSTIDFYRRWNRIPDVRVVSVNHKNRTNDLTPTEYSQRFPGSGNAANFLKHLKTELMPYIDANFGKSAQNILVGHSFGGLFALYTLGMDQALFEGYIAISASTWWKDKYLFGLNYEEKLNSLKKTPFIYLSSAEFDSGITTLSNKEFIDWFSELNFKDSIKIEYDLFKGENHFTNVAVTFQQALNKFFPGPGLKGEIEKIYAEENLDALKNWYKDKKEVLKERLVFPEEAFLGLALKLIQSQKNKQATRLLEWILKEQPNSGNGYYYLGYNESQAGNIEDAKEAYEKALTKNLPERVKTVIRNSLRGLSQQQVSISKKILEGIVSTNAVEYGITISKSQDSIFFVRHDGNWGSRDNPPSNIFITTKHNGGWSKPVLATFSYKEYNDSDIFIASDNSIFFTSNRPYEGKKGKSSDIFKIEYLNGKWLKPKPLSKYINTENTESSPVTNDRGDLYFSSTRAEGYGMGDIYMAEKLPDGSYKEPKIVSPVSTKHGEWNVFVAPDNSYMIFESSGRPNAKSPYGDLYYSKNIQGEWQEAKPLSILNSTGSDLNIRLSPDNKYFYYASSERLESRDVDIFKVLAEDVMTLINKL